MYLSSWFDYRVEYFKKKLHACKVNLKRVRYFPYSFTLTHKLRVNRRIQYSNILAILIHYIQAIKKAKDAEARKIVKNLKKVQESGHSQTREAELEDKLHQIRRLDVDSLWQTLCDTKNMDELEESTIFCSESPMVMEQIENMRNILVQIEHAQSQCPANDTTDGGTSIAPNSPRKDVGVKNTDSSTSKTDQKDRAPKKPKKAKNRMGQRARQRLAEKLHGISAKHKQNKHKNVQGSIMNTKTKKNSNPEVPLHPSWAAKKQQEAIKIDLTNVSSKKIVFD